MRHLILKFRQAADLTKLAWTEVSGASGYVLERGSDEAFTKTYPVYEGGDTSFHVLRVLSPIFAAPNWCRVRAKSLLGADGPWSNVLRLDPPPKPE